MRGVISTRPPPGSSAADSSRGAGLQEDGALGRVGAQVRPCRRRAWPSEPTTTRSPWKTPRRCGVGGRDLDELARGEELAARARPRPRARSRSSGRSPGAGARWASARAAASRGRTARCRPAATAAAACARRPAHAAAADLLEREAGVEGRPRRRAGWTPSPPVRRPSVEADARGEVGDDLPLGAHGAGMADGGAQALQAPVGVRERPLLLGVGLGGEDDGRVLADALGEERRVGDDGRRLARAPPPRARGPAASAAGRRAGGTARSARPRRPPRRCPRRRAPSAVGSRARGRRWAGRRPRAGRARWTSRGPRAGRRRRGRAATRRPATFSSARAACAPRAPCDQALAPDDDDVLAGVAQQVGDARSPRAWSSPRPARARRARRPPPSAALTARRGTPRRRPARSARRRRRSGPATTGRLEAMASLTPCRRTPLRMRRSTIGMSSTGSQSRTRTAWANSRSGTVACTRGAAERGVQLAREAPPEARVEVRRVEPLAHEALQEEALLVRRPAAGQRADAAARAAQCAGRGLERALPAHRAQLAAVAQQRLGDALVDVDGLVGEAARGRTASRRRPRRCRGRGRAGRARRGR